MRSSKNPARQRVFYLLIAIVLIEVGSLLDRLVGKGTGLTRIYAVSYRFLYSGFRLSRSCLIHRPTKRTAYLLQNAVSVRESLQHKRLYP